MERSIEVISTEVESIDDYSAVVRCLLADGETGDGMGEAWMVAGVPDYQQGTADAAGSWRGLESVWAFGDSLNSWCPEPLFNQHEDVLEACWRPALKAWRAADASRG